MADPDQHPITLCPPDMTVEQRMHWFEHHFALLWDQVWWLSLPPERRAEFQAQGFTDPITQFYGRSDPWPKG